MSLLLHPLIVPLSIDETGTVRVTNTRITLDLVVSRFEDGATPEEIVHSYDTLRLGDVYLVVAYYLSHKEEVAAYLQRREEEATAVRQRLEAAGITRPGFWDQLKQRSSKLVAEG